MSGSRRWTDDELRNAIKTSYSFRQVANKLKLSRGTKNYKRLKYFASILCIDTSHFVSKFGSKRRLSFNDVFNENSDVHSSTLRNRAKEILPYYCNICNNQGIHLGMILVLHLDHVDGNNKNNKLDNLRWLCPNCHSQTNTYCGRNLKNK